MNSPCPRALVPVPAIAILLCAGSCAPATLAAVRQAHASRPTARVARPVHRSRRRGATRRGDGSSRAARARRFERAHGRSSRKGRDRHRTGAHALQTTGKAAPSRAHHTLATPPTSQCADTELTPTPANLALIETATLCLVNQERAREGERPLRPNADLERAAQEHSEEMVAADYFAHDSPTGLTPLARVRASGYLTSSEEGAYTLGENIAWGTLGLSTPSAIVSAWIASPEHLANILYAPYRDTGIGVAAAAPASLAEGQPGAVYSQELGVLLGLR